MDAETPLTTIKGQKAAVTHFEVSSIASFRGEVKIDPWVSLLARNAIGGL